MPSVGAGSFCHQMWSCARACSTSACAGSWWSWTWLQGRGRCAEDRQSRQGSFNRGCENIYEIRLTPDHESIMTIVWQTGWTRVFARPAGFWMMTQEYVPGSKLLRIRTLRQKYPPPLNATLTTSTSAAVAGAGGKVGNAGGERLGVFQGRHGTVFPRVIACARSANSPRDVLRPAPCCTPRAISPSESVSLLQQIGRAHV